MAEKRYNPWFKDMSNKMNTPKESFFFDSPRNMISIRTSKEYGIPIAWHNQFLEQITGDINGDLIRLLFKDGIISFSHFSNNKLANDMVLGGGKLHHDEYIRIDERLSYLLCSNLPSLYYFC
ncbi:MAG TPA: hypothetical protein DIS88_05325 [Prevotella sp.]|nr:hypothetical protein [Prevotella sp.]